MEAYDFSYYAFISYKREDERWAKWLQRKLETYRLPSVIRKDKGLPQNLRPIFRDKTDLGVGVLKESLVSELQQSKYLIVICSPVSAKSRWVGEEVKTFIAMGREKQIIPFVVDGDLNPENPENCYLHPALQQLENELLCIDVRESGREVAFVKVVAGLLNFPFDRLWKRHRRYKIRKFIIIFFVAIALIISVLYAVLFARPMTMNVDFEQIPFENTNLPMPQEGGKVCLSYGEKNDTILLDDLHNTLLFSEIPGIFRNKTLDLHFEMYGFETIDTTFGYAKRITLPIKRDNTYSKIKGLVENDFGAPQKNVEVQVFDYKCVTDNNGGFEIEIPLREQREEYEVAVFKNSQQVLKQKIYPLSESLLIIR